MKIANSAPRFALVGTAATLIHVAVAVGFVEKAHWHPSLANGIAFVVANLFSYAANTHWSFNAKIGIDSWYRFVIVSFVAWLLTVTTTWMIAAIGGAYPLGILLVVTLIPVISYIGHAHFTYK